MHNRATIRRLSLAILVIALMASGAFSQWQKTNGLNHSGYVRFANIEDAIFATTYYADGVYRSTDSGLSWKLLTEGLPEIAIYGNIICSSNFIVVFTSNGIYRSTNGGELWSKVSEERFYYSSGASENGHYLFATNGGKPLISSNDGQTWAKTISTGLPNERTTYSISCINSFIFLGTNRGLYRSTDNGEHWDSINSPFSSIYELYSNHNDLYIVGDSRIAQSTDNGDKWKIIISNNTLQSRCSMAFLTDTIFIGCPFQGSLFRSDDNGGHWHNSDSGMLDNSISGLYIHKGILIAAAYGDWMYRSTNRGHSWSRIIGGNPKGIIGYSLATDNNALYISTSYGIYRSDDGINWKPKSKGFYYGDNRMLAVDDGNIICLVDNYGDSYTSSNKGDTWFLNGGYSYAYNLSIINKVAFIGLDSYIVYSTDYGFNWNGSALSTYPYASFTCFASLGPKIFAGTSYAYFDQPKFFSSVDSGKKWEPVIPLDSRLDSSYLSFSTMISINNTLIAGTTDSGIFISIDSGASWRSANSNLPFLQIQALTTDGKNIYAGTRNGVFYSSDFGYSWRGMGYELDESINSLVIFKGYLYAAADNQPYSKPTYQGVWRRPISDFVTVNKQPTNYFTSFTISSSPNPFTIETSLTITCTERVPLRLKIFDILGKKVYDGVEKMYEMGQNVVRLDGSNFPNGMLFATLTSPNGATATTQLRKIE